MIKLVKLSEEERIEKEKLLKLAPSAPKTMNFVKKLKPVYLSNIDRILLIDEFLGNHAPDFVDDFEVPFEIIDSAVENHLQTCEFCTDGEPCPNLPSILAA